MNWSRTFVFRLTMCFVPGLASFNLIYLSARTASIAKAAIVAPDLPANGKIAFFVGQNSDTLSSYHNNSSLPQPAGVTLSTNIVEGGTPGPLDGIGADVWAT